MTHEEMVALVQGGIPGTGGTWADFGAGSGNFTRVLRDLLGETAAIYAVDRDSSALKLLRNRWPPGDEGLHILAADFTQPLDLPLLDGLLMANSLHFVRKQREVAQHVAQYLRPSGRWLLVEYDVTLPRSFIPHPVPFNRFESLALGTGFLHPARVGSRRSPSTGMVMYAAAAHTSS